MSVGALIKAARLAAGMSQPDLAELLQLHTSMVSKLENDKVFVEPETYRRLTLALRGLSPVALLNAMGYSVAVPGADRLPRQLVSVLLELQPDDLLVVERVARGLRQEPASRPGEVQ